MDFSSETLFNRFFDNIVEAKNDVRNKRFFDFVTVDEEERTLMYSW